jgi:hypothetical protein
MADRKLIWQSVKTPEQSMPTQTSPNLDDLVRMLNTATDKDRIQWNKTADEDTFRTQFGTAMVRIGASPLGASYVISLLDNQGTLLEQYQPSGEGQMIAVEALYQKIRRQALNLEFKLKNVFDQLKNIADEV